MAQLHLGHVDSALVVRDHAAGEIDVGIAGVVNGHAAVHTHGTRFKFCGAGGHRCSCCSGFGRCAVALVLGLRGGGGAQEEGAQKGVDGFHGLEMIDKKDSSART